MSDHLNISDFLSPVNLREVSYEEGYKDGQLRKKVPLYEEEFPDLDEIKLYCNKNKSTLLSLRQKMVQRSKGRRKITP